jgi:hypothetical protein
MKFDTPQSITDEATHRHNTLLPTRVYIGLVISILTILVGLVSIIGIPFHLAYGFDSAASYTLFALLMLSAGFVLYKHFAGHNWARLVLTGVISLFGGGLLVLGSYLLATTYTSDDPKSEIGKLLAIAILALSAIHLVSAALLALSGAVRHYQYYVSSKRTNGAKVD